MQQLMYIRPCRECGDTWAGNGGVCDRCLSRRTSSRRRRAVLVPLAAVTVAAAVVVPAVLTMGTRLVASVAVSPPTATPTAGAAPDTCLAGTWTEAAHREKVSILGF